MKKMIYILLPLLLVSSLYALPKKIQADRYLLEAKKSIDNKNYKRAIAYFEKILALNVKMPNELHYHYAKALKEEDQAEKCLNHLELFLTNDGDKTKYYTKALNLYTICENKKNIIYKGRKYTQITSPHTGRIWLDRNIGARKVCKTSTDKFCYGKYYTWDKAMKSCPSGFSLPSIEELKAETIDIGVKNAKGAFNSFLKLPLAGYYNYSILRDSRGSSAFIWSSSRKGKDPWYLYFSNSDARTSNYDLEYRYSTRCIKALKN